MSENNTLDLSDLTSEPVESNVEVEISDAPDDVEEEVSSEEEVEEPEEVVEEPEEEVEEPEVVVEEPEVPVEPEVPAEPEVPVAPSTEEVVETVQSILTEPVVDNSTDLQERVEVLEEKLNNLINILKKNSKSIIVNREINIHM